MSRHERHLSNYRSAQQRVNAAANFKVPGGSQKLDARLPTEQLPAIVANLKVIDMRLAKAIKAGDAVRVAKLRDLQGRKQEQAQMVADAINAQWDRDDKWHNSNADISFDFFSDRADRQGTILAQPRYRNEAERSEALALQKKI